MVEQEGLSDARAFQKRAFEAQRPRGEHDARQQREQEIEWRTFHARRRELDGVARRKQASRRAVSYSGFLLIFLLLGSERMNRRRIKIRRPSAKVSSRGYSSS